MATRIRDQAPRFGIGEWFGKSVVLMTAAERRAIAEEVLKPKRERVPQPCPFQATKANAMCSKDGGVCSLRLYAYAPHPGPGPATGRAMGVPIEGPQGELRATCPYRFHEAKTAFNWVGEEVLGDSTPYLVGEVGFLEAGSTTDADGGDDVGRIDMILVKSGSPPEHPMEWAALEIQAVYFSGQAMRGEFEAFADPSVDWVIFPAAKRRPDYRSSGPKRLMPQLQIKIPTLRRWGKKMAVVVDRAFFDSIGDMDNVAHISNADIAWFVVKFEAVDGTTQMRMVKDEVRYTTLERSVEGLTGGTPVTLPIFQARIAEKVAHPAPSHRIGPTVLPNSDTDEADEIRADQIQSER